MKTLKTILYALIISLFFSLVFSPKIVRISPANAKSTDSLTRIENSSPSEPQGQESTSSVLSYVLKQAKIYGVDPIKAKWIIGHESEYGQNLYGDDGNSLGFWQISTIYHPEVGRECSLSLQCSTSWSLRWIAAGNQNQWSSWKFRCKWYPNENPPYCKTL